VWQESCGWLVISQPMVSLLPYTGNTQINVSVLIKLIGNTPIGNHRKIIITPSDRIPAPYHLPTSGFIAL
jgi:hypothetical protein